MAAVEFALVVPLLLLLVLGIAEFGRAYNIKLSLSAAAREGARVMAISQDQAAAVDATEAALTFTADDIDVSGCPSPPSASAPNATVTVVYSFEFLSDLIPGGPIELSGTGVMLCGG